MILNFFMSKDANAALKVPETFASRKYICAIHKKAI